MIRNFLRNLFPNVLAAVEKREAHKADLDCRDLWAIGDALIDDCGRPNRDVAISGRGKRDGSTAKIKQCAAILNERGFKGYENATLLDLREGADTFGKSKRHVGISMWVHLEAGSPDFMDWIVEQHGTGKRGGAGISVPQIRKLRKRWKELERQQRKKAYEAAKEEERHAPTPQAKEKARERVEELRGMPEPSPRTLPRPDRESAAQLDVMADNLDLSAQSKTIVADLRKQLSTIDGMKDGIHPDFIEALDDIYKEAETVIKQIRQRLEKTRLKRFDTIKGGKAS